MKRCGEALRQWRTENGVTQAQVAEWLRSNYGTRKFKSEGVIGKFERGQHHLPLADRIIIAERTGLALESLTGKREQKWILDAARLLGESREARG